MSGWRTRNHDGPSEGAIFDAAEQASIAMDIAEEMISERTGCPVEEVAETYLSELIELTDALMRRRDLEAAFENVERDKARKLQQEYL